MSAAPDGPPGRAFATAGHPIFVVDLDRQAVCYANCRACLLLGYDIDDLLALPVSAVFSADGRALETLLEAIAKQGEGSTTTVALRAKSGALLPAEMLAFRLRTGGQRHVLVLANVVSARYA